MRLVFFPKLTTTWVSGCICLMLASLAVAQDAKAQTEPELNYASADWSSAEFWKSKNPLSKDTSGWVFEDGEVRLEQPKQRPSQRAHLISPPMPPN